MYYYAWLSCTQDYTLAAVFMQWDRIAPSKVYWVLSDNVDFIRSFIFLNVGHLSPDIHPPIYLYYWAVPSMQ